MHGADAHEETRDGADDYAADEIGFFFGALASARDQFGHVTKELAREYGVGPRGPWMVGLIGRQPVAPRELAAFFNTGKSLITAELRQLQEAGLINYAKSDSDGRKVELSLTPLGNQLRKRVTAGLALMFRQRLGGYSKNDIMLCARLLSDFARGNQYARLSRDSDPED